jgi:transcriptional regulator with XRE-family HTH domain
MAGVWQSAAMNFDAMSEQAVLAELGRRVQAQRLNLNLAQADVARKAGISRRALQKLEGGQAGTLMVFLRTLRALGKAGLMEMVLPEPGISPLQLARLKGQERQRASKPRRAPTPDRR